MFFNQNGKKKGTFDSEHSLEANKAHQRVKEIEQIHSNSMQGEATNSAQQSNSISMSGKLGSIGYMVSNEDKTFKSADVAASDGLNLDVNLTED